jgi:hypothetical protein
MATHVADRRVLLTDPVRPLPELNLHSRKVLLDDRPNGVDVSIFHGFCEISGRQWCATRRVRGGDWGASTVELDGEHLDFGEDPRIFVHLGRPAIVSAVYMPGYGMRNHLYEMHDGGFTRSLLLPPENLPSGKNWSPFSARDGSIGFVHSFDPPTILTQVRREAGLVVLAAQQTPRVAAEIGPGAFPAFRGGSNAIWVDGFFLGIGHTTRYLPGQSSSLVPEHGFDHLRHRPFGWVMAGDYRRLLVFDVSGPFADCFDIIDPTSLIAHADGSFELFTTEVSRHFHDPEGAREAVSYRFDLSEAFRSEVRRALAEQWLAAPAFVGHSVTEVASWYSELAGRSGHVISGPYMSLTAGHYAAVFDFTCSGAAGDEPVIELDVVSGMDVVARVELDGAGVHDAAARTLRFVHEHSHKTVEFRIAVNGFTGGLLRFTGVHLVNESPGLAG